MPLKSLHCHFQKISFGLTFTFIFFVGFEYRLQAETESALSPESETTTSSRNEISNTGDPDCVDLLTGLKKNVLDLKKFSEEKINQIQISMDQNVLQSEQRLKYIIRLKNSKNCKDYEKIDQAVKIVDAQLRSYDILSHECDRNITNKSMLKNVNELGYKPQDFTCMSTCYTYVGNSLEDCSKKCNTNVASNDAFYFFLSDLELSSQQHKTCPQMTIIQKKQFENLFTKLTEQIKIKFPKMIDICDRYIENIETKRKLMDARLKNLLDKKLMFTNQKCSIKNIKDELATEDRVKLAHSLNENGKENGFSGTVFFVESNKKGEGVPITALHVSRGDPPIGVDEIQMNYDKSPNWKTNNLKNNEDTVRFKIKPNKHDNSQDVTIGETKKIPFKPFPVIEAQNLPKKGEKFILSGYPGNRNKNFTQHTCQFRGYSNLVPDDPFNKSMGYLLYCPTAESVVYGMSGGPMTDQQGRAWGTISKATQTGFVTVTPLSKNAENELQIGFKNVFNSNDCYRLVNGVYQRFTCQILNGDVGP